MSTNINLMVQVTREQQIEIEEYCTNYSKTLSEYLIGLHNERKENKENFSMLYKQDILQHLPESQGNDSLAEHAIEEPKDNGEKGQKTTKEFRTKKTSK